MINKIKSKLEIGAILTLALILSIFTARLFFVNNTPQISSSGASTITSTVLSWLKDHISRDTANQVSSGNAVVFNRLEERVFSPVAKGVSAREANGVSEVRYEVSKVNWVGYTFTTKEGKTLRLEIPEGEAPPPQSLIDLLY
jgi:hypothetical protein